MKESSSLLGICDRSGPITDPEVEVLVGGTLKDGVLWVMETFNAVSWTVLGGAAFSRFLVADVSSTGAG